MKQKSRRERRLQRIHHKFFDFLDDHLDRNQEANTFYGRKYDSNGKRKWTTL